MMIIKSWIPYLSVLFLLGVILADGCSNPQELPSHVINIDGINRTYHLFVPAGLTSEPVPLLVAFHGGGGAGEEFPQQEQFEKLASTEKIILAFPQGYQIPDNEGEWQLNTQSNARHDIRFIDRMIDEISSRNAVDSSRIYATGYSLGSMFSYEIACQMSERFAAIASFAGTMPISPVSCTPQKYTPLIHIHGEDDYIIAYDETWNWKNWEEVGTMMDIPSLITYWSTKYKCQKTDELLSTSTTHFVHKMCDQGARVEHYRIEGLGHGWPDRINGISTHQQIWSFVSEFSL